MTIRKKLILSFTFLMLLLGGLGIISIISIKNVNNTATVIDSEILPQINCAQTLRFDMTTFRSYEFNHIIITDNTGKDAL